MVKPIVAVGKVEGPPVEVHEDPPVKFVQAQYNAPPLPPGQTQPQTATPLKAPQPAAAPRGPLGTALERRIDAELARFHGSTPEARRQIIEKLRTVNPDLLRFSSPGDAATVLRDLGNVQRALKQAFRVTLGDGALLQTDIKSMGGANCFGSTQVFLALARAQSVQATPIHAERGTDGGDALHVASLVSLPDGRVATVDVLLSDAVSAPFDLAARYRNNGRALDINPNEAGTTYARMRLFGDEGFNAFLGSQSSDVYKGATRLEQFAAADPQNAWNHHALAEAYLASDPNRYDVLPTGTQPRSLAANTPGGRALAAYQRALAVDPEHVTALKDSGLLYMYAGQPQSAAQQHAREAQVLERNILRALGSRAAPGTADAVIAGASGHPQQRFAFGALKDALSRWVEALEAAGRKQEAKAVAARLKRLEGAGR